MPTRYATQQALQRPPQGSEFDGVDAVLPIAAHWYEVPNVVETQAAPGPVCRATGAAARPLGLIAYPRASHGPNGSVADGLDEAQGGVPGGVGGAAGRQ